MHPFNHSFTVKKLISYSTEPDRKKKKINDLFFIIVSLRSLTIYMKKKHTSLEFSVNGLNPSIPSELELVSCVTEGSCNKENSNYYNSTVII